ncbi:MAG: trans-2-enoyl-CoA reductase family protein, partial [Dehalococcoidia bacterium]
MPKVVIEPRIRGFISLTAHPEGCAANVREQVAIARAGTPQGARIGSVLVIGSSTGYGLASALVACFGYGAKTLGVCFEKAPEGDKPGTAGWYNLAEAHRLAKESGLTFRTINGDAFSPEVKAEVVRELRNGIGPVDLVIYSLAAPRRKDAQGNIWNSTLKPIGGSYTGKGFDLRNEAVTESSIEAATDEEIAGTIKVMGGEDWREWTMLLKNEGLLAPGARNVAYSYIGPDVSAAIYRRGTIGRAKEDLERTAHELHPLLDDGKGGGAWVSVNKGLVTQASSAIPAVPLYISILFKVMKDQGSHEGTIEQMVRLFREQIRPGATPTVDAEGRIRLDDWEMAAPVQTVVEELWNETTTENLSMTTDYAGFKSDFYRLFGFGVDGVDYS